jgi:hypothetical protein
VAPIASAAAAAAGVGGSCLRPEDWMHALSLRMMACGLSMGARSISAFVAVSTAGPGAVRARGDGCRGGAAASAAVWAGGGGGGLSSSSSSSSSVSEMLST